MKITFTLFIADEIIRIYHIRDKKESNKKKGKNLIEIEKLELKKKKHRQLFDHTSLNF